MPHEPHEPPTHPFVPSRRQLIAGGAVGAGIVASGVLLPGTAFVAAGSGGSGPSNDDAVTGEPVVAHVRNVATGEIDVYIGERQVRIRDRGVAARLARASR